MVRILIVLFINFIIILEINGTRHRCINSGILFTDKILRSPVIVYGESIGKKVYVDTHTDFLFNVTFRVDCVLKGQDVENRIEITDAGIKSGHTACQWLEPGHIYVVFLENWGSNANTYRPLDFQERLVDNMTYELLEKTCHLRSILPLRTTINRCPNVSLKKYCPHDEIDVSILSKENNVDHSNFNVKSSYFNNNNQFQLQSNITIPKDGSISSQFYDNTKNDGSLIRINFMLIAYATSIGGILFSNV